MFGPLDRRPVRRADLVRPDGTQPEFTVSRGDPTEDHKGMRRLTDCRRGTRYALLLLGLFQVSGCSDGSIPLLTSPLLSLVEEEENRPPFAVGLIQAQRLIVGGDGVRLDVGPYFRDPDDDALRYTAASSDFRVVSASVLGGIVTLRPVSDGSAIVTVTATDPDGLSATQRILVRVHQSDTGGSRPACTVGLVVRIGESCTVDIPGVRVSDNGFQVTADGRGCYDTICSSDSLTVDGFRATRQSNGDWRIDALPEGGGAGPDLVVESPAVSSSTVVPEGFFTLSATVRNQGGGRSVLTTLRYYRSSDATISTGDVEEGTDSVFGLSAGTSGSESIRLAAPNSPGTYYYGACVEPVSQESDTGNNCSVGVPLTVEAVPGPDLVVESPGVSSSTVVPGGSFTLSATVRNQGGGRSDSTTLRYYRSLDATISTGDTEVGTDFVSRLSGGATGLDSIRLTAPDAPGTYYYGACVEPVSQESDTGNNCSAGVSLTVESGGGEPDLVVESPEVSRTKVVADGFFTLSATVRNGGTGPSGSTTLRYYRSSDSTISTGDTQVETTSLEALTAGRSVKASVLVRAPSSEGTYYYGACVDAVSGESDTSDNCSAGVKVEVGTTGPACTVGQLLSSGEFCTVVIPGLSLTDNRFRVNEDGEGCYELFCSGGSLSLNGFVATKQSDGRWRIDALPEGE